MGSKRRSTGSGVSERKTNGLRTRFLKATAFARHKLVVEVRKLEATIRKDVYDRLAAELQDVLLQGWSKAQKEAIDTVIRAIKGRNSTAQLELFTENNLNEMIASLRPILGDRFAGDIAKAMKEIELQSYGIGLTGSVKVQPTFHLIDRQALRFLEDHNVYWVKNFYDKQLREKVVELGSKVLEEGMNRQQAGQIFEDAFADQLETYSWRYWQGFANHVVTRSREFGAVERYVRAQRNYLQVKAIIDHRTTEVCRHMHNKVFKVSSAVEIRDKLLAAETPEQVIEIAPWMKPAAIRGKPSTALPNHMSLPPYHFNCRTRTVTITDKEAAKELEHQKNIAIINQNSDYKNNVEEFLKRDPIPSHPQLDFEESAAIYAYTNTMYDGVNRSLRAGKLSKFEKAYASVVDRGLAKIRSKKGTYKRGINLNNIQREAYQPGNDITWNSFISTSSTNAFNKNTEFLIEDGVGVPVTRFSAFAFENEFIIRPGSKFTVLEREDVGNKTYIRMKQVTGKRQNVFKMTDKMKKFIEESDQTRQEFEALEGEEKVRAEEQLQHLTDRMQAEENVTVLKK